MIINYEAQKAVNKSVFGNKSGLTIWVNVNISVIVTNCVIEGFRSEGIDKFPKKRTKNCQKSLKFSPALQNFSKNM